MKYLKPGDPYSTCTYQTVWSYSLQKHYELKHSAVAIPPAMQAAMKLGVHEKEWLELVKAGKRPKPGTIAGCPCQSA